MNELGLAVPFWLLALIWLAKTIWLVFICTILAWLGIGAERGASPLSKTSSFAPWQGIQVRG